MFILAFYVEANSITVYVGEEPFLSFQDKENGELKGLAIDTIKLLFAEVGDTPEIKVQPFARIEKSRKQNKDQLFIMFYQNEQPLKNFHQVGLITNFPINIYKLKTNDNIIINTQDDLKNYSFGVVRGGGRERYFKAKELTDNFKQHIVSTDEQNILRFFIGRFDVLIENPIVLKFFAKTKNIDLSLVEKIMPLAELSGNMGLFFSKNTDTSLILKYKNALTKIQQTAEFKLLLKGYGANL
jgi:polar amino acid transport system substrate-binding protein